MDANEFKLNTAFYTDVVRFLQQREQHRQHFINNKIESYKNFEEYKKKFIFTFIEKDKEKLMEPINLKEKEPILMRILKTKTIKRGKTPELIRPREYFKRKAEDIMEEGNLSIHNNNFLNSDIRLGENDKYLKEKISDNTENVKYFDERY